MVTWLDASEIVAGLILNKKISSNSVRPEMFFADYAKLIQEIKEGNYEIEDLIEKCGLSIIQASLDAAKSINGLGDKNWIQILEKTANSYLAGQLMEKLGRRLQNGEDIDWSQLVFITQKAQEGTPDFVPLSQVEGGSVPFIETGWTAIDTHLGGLPSIGLIVVGGSPGIGKTSFMITLSSLFARKYTEKTVAIFSLEMVLPEIAHRYENIASLSQEVKDRILLYDIPVSPEECINKASTISNLGLICIDFADLMIKGDTTESAMAHIYRTLMIGAKQLGVPILLLSQLNRNYFGNIPRPSHLRYTGLAEALAWMILMLYNPNMSFFKEEEMMEGGDNTLPIEEGRAYIIAWKCRGGFRQHINDAPGAISLPFSPSKGWSPNNPGKWFTLKKVL